jgi:REP element-mobilizing transposase RayT
LRPGLPSLRRSQELAILRSAFAASSAEETFRAVQYSLQSNHVHLIVEAHDAVALSTGMKGLLVRIARGLNRAWGRTGTVFRDRYHVRALRTPREVRFALVYVLQNARKHGIVVRGLDPFTSGEGSDGCADSSAGVADDSGRLEVRPRTWLLSTGWLRWGRIRIAESPRLPGPRELRAG